jgi:hypothetical protein
MSIPRLARAWFCLRRVSTPAETTFVSGSFTARASCLVCCVMTWPLFGNLRAGHAYDCGKQVISASRGRSVVLTIGRLVASNPSFASFHAPAYLRPAGSNISMAL